MESRAIFDDPRWKSLRRIPASQARGGISELIRDAERGSRILVTRSGKPTVAIVPLTDLAILLHGDDEAERRMVEALNRRPPATDENTADFDEFFRSADAEETRKNREAMTYVEGFVLAVPTANKDAYRKHAAKWAPTLQEFGVRRMVEAWGDDVQHGKLTDFYGAVQAKENETVVFSWFEYPDRATRDAANEKMMNDPRMQEMGEVPFDAQRMIFSGFHSFIDERADGASNYIDGFVLPVPEDKRQAYHEMAAKAAGKFKEYGAVRVVEAWGDDVRDDKVINFKKAVRAEPGENVVFSWIEWPGKATRNAAWEKMMKDPDMQPDPDNIPFDGIRMFWGGFVPIVDTAAAKAAERELA